MSGNIIVSSTTQINKNLPNQTNDIKYCNKYNFSLNGEKTICIFT